MIPTTWTLPAKLCLCAAVIIVLSQATDADLLDREVIAMNTLRATTVDLSTLDTANETQKSLFFTIQGLLAGGFQVTSVRIKNDGELHLTVKNTAQDLTGSSELCGALQLKVLKNWQSVYDGPLSNFSYQVDIEAGQAEDLVFALGLATANPTLTAQNCSFNFLVESIQEAGGGSIRFSDTEVLQNQVSTGTWSE